MILSSVAFMAIAPLAGARTVAGGCQSVRQVPPPDADSCCVASPPRPGLGVGWVTPNTASISCYMLYTGELPACSYMIFEISLRYLYASSAAACLDQLPVLTKFCDTGISHLMTSTTRTMIFSHSMAAQKTGNSHPSGQDRPRIPGHTLSELH